MSAHNTSVQILIEVYPEADGDDHVRGEQSHSDQPVRGAVLEGEGDEHHRQEESLRFVGAHVQRKVLLDHPADQNKKRIHHESYLRTGTHGNA